MYNYVCKYAHGPHTETDIGVGALTTHVLRPTSAPPIWFPQLSGDARARRWCAVPMSHGWSRVRVALRVRQAVHGCVLEGDADAAARSVFNDLFGLVIEVIVLQAATGRSQGVRGGYKGARVVRPPDKRTRRTIEGSIALVRAQKACRKQGAAGRKRKCVERGLKRESRDYRIKVQGMRCARGHPNPCSHRRRTDNTTMSDRHTHAAHQPVWL